VITAVDTSVILDILTANPAHIESSKGMFIKCQLQGRVIACPIVWSELRPLFNKDAEMETTMERLGVDFDLLDMPSALLAGMTWKDYRSRGGPRERIISDFLIGAHATVRANRLLTRDRGFYRNYFKKLVVVEGGL